MSDTHKEGDAPRRRPGIGGRRRDHDLYDLETGNHCRSRPRHLREGLGQQARERLAKHSLGLVQDTLEWGYVRENARHTPLKEKKAVGKAVGRGERAYLAASDREALVARWTSMGTLACQRDAQEINEGLRDSDTHPLSGPIRHRTAVVMGLVWYGMPCFFYIGHPNSGGAIGAVAEAC